MMFLQSASEFSSSVVPSAQAGTMPAGCHFNRDVFCRARPGRAALSNAPKARVSKILAMHYGRHLGNIQSITQLCGNNINSLNYRVSSSEGLFLLKKMPAAGEKKCRALALHQGMAEAARRESLFLPQIYPSSEGALASLAHGSAWVLLEWMPGEHYVSGAGQLTKIFEKIGRLNNFLRSFSARSFSFKYYRFYDPFEIRVARDFQRWLNRGRAAGKDPFERLLRSFGERAPFFLSEKSLKRISGMFYHCCLTHIDLHPQNVLISGKGVVSFLDSESILFSNRISCVGYALFKFMRNYVAASLNKKKAVDSLEQIRHTITERLVSQRAFRREETDLFALGAHAMILKRILYILRDYFQFKRRTWASFLPMHIEALRESVAIFGASSGTYAGFITDWEGGVAR